MLITSYSPRVNQRVQHVVLKTDDSVFTVEYMCMITGRTTIERYAVPLTKREIEAEYDYILFPVTVNNRIEHNTVYSNLVYPDWTNREKFQVLGVLDQEYVEEELERLFECNSIANKYAIQMPNGMLWYKHDYKTFLLKSL